MSDSESIKKMLRSVLQSSKNGVSISSLQSEYRSLCGEIIPLKKLGYSNLEDYLRSIPTVVRLQYFMGEVRTVRCHCFLFFLLMIEASPSSVSLQPSEVVMLWLIGLLP